MKVASIRVVGEHERSKEECLHLQFIHEWITQEPNIMSDARVRFQRNFRRAPPPSKREPIGFFQPTVVSAAQLTPGMQRVKCRGEEPSCPCVRGEPLPDARDTVSVLWVLSGRPDGVGCGENFLRNKRGEHFGWKVNGCKTLICVCW